MFTQCTTVITAFLSLRSRSCTGTRTHPVIKVHTGSQARLAAQQFTRCDFWQILSSLFYIAEHETQTVGSSVGYCVCGYRTGYVCAQHSNHFLYFDKQLYHANLWIS